MKERKKGARKNLLDLFDDIKAYLKNIITSRMTIMAIIIIALSSILIYRCFDLQIVQGQEYLDQFILETEKTRDIASTRGNILDCNGKILAYNELAYSVKIEDVYESGISRSVKNNLLNTTIYKLIQMIEENGDKVVTDFDVIIDEDGNFVYNVEGTSLLRFLADVYGHTTIDKLEPAERSATAEELINYLGGTLRFGIGGYKEEGNSKSDFIVGKGYTKEELLKMITIRYAMDLTSFRKYIGTTVATDVSEKTVAVIMEHSSELDGVTIEEDTVRRYNDSEYFAQLMGYTGKISSEELKNLNAQEEENGGTPDRYTINDVVGKNGIEAYMETTLRGVKGQEKVSVDNMGKVTSVLERTEAQAGNDVWLTLDSELQKAVYHILEQHIAGIIMDKLVDKKEYIAAPNAKSSDIEIPIYDVYFAMINNSVLDIEHFKQENAKEKEKEVYAKYTDYQRATYEKLRQELTETKTNYQNLSKEYQIYQSNIVSMLNQNGVINSEKVDKNDATQIAWTTEEVISLNEYLNYIIAQNWIDVSKLELDDKYSDSQEIYSKLMDYIIEMLDKNTEFQKKLYKYMLLNDVISGKDICMLLCEQEAITISEEDREKLYSGQISAFHFMKNRMENLEVTPAQLALDPCNGSVVIVDTNTGAVKAMVTYPGYDNNKLANSVDAKYWAKLITDKSNPNLNYATQYKAAPGSTVKMMVATAGLLEGVIQLNTSINCTGIYNYLDQSPKCWRTWGHGQENVQSAIKDSCNFFFYDVGYRLATQSGTYNEEEGLALLEKYADMYGLTEKTGVEVPEYSPDFSISDPVRSAIGQGSHSYTTVGIARYIATVANSGTCFNLTLLKQTTNSSGEVIQEFAPNIRNTIEMPKENWNAIHAGMRAVVENKTYFSNLAVNVAGKTGTAEQTKSRPNHALFVGYAPYEQPEIAIATRIPFGYSSDYAAQTTRDIIMYYYGLAEDEDLITGTADAPDAGVSTNEF